MKSRDEHRDECCDENCYENRFECGFEFKCVFEGRFEYGFERAFECVYTQSENAVSWLWANQLRVEKCDCERMRVQVAHTSVALNNANTSADSANSTTPLTRTAQVKRGKPRTGTTDAAKVTQIEPWRLEKCDLRIKAWEAREIQLEVRAGAKRGCLSKWQCPRVC